MKTTFTYLRCIIVVLFFSITYINSFSQAANAEKAFVTDLTVAVENNQVLVNWVIPDVSTSNYCEVQSSLDGKTFSTIGMVMGADPRQTNNGYAFKQGLKKLKQGRVYYRVLNVGTNGKAYASNVIKTTK